MSHLGTGGARVEGGACFANTLHSSMNTDGLTYYNVIFQLYNGVTATDLVLKLRVLICS